MSGASSGLAVSALVVRSGAIVLVQRGCGVGAGLWAPPGGKVERGEGIVSACIREVSEETGLEIRVRRILAAVEVFGPESYCIIPFLAVPVPSYSTVMAGSDARAACWCGTEEAKRFPLAPGVRSLINAAFPARLG